MSMKARVFRFSESKKKESEGETIWEYPNTEIGLAFGDEKEAPLHHHDKTTEWYLVVEGEGEVILDGVRHSLKKGDVVYIPPEVKHKAIGKGEFKVFVVSVPPYSQNDFHKDV